MKKSTWLDNPNTDSNHMIKFLIQVRFFPVDIHNFFYFWLIFFLWCVWNKKTVKHKTIKTILVFMQVLVNGRIFVGANVHQF